MFVVRRNTGAHVVQTNLTLLRKRRANGKQTHSLGNVKTESRGTDTQTYPWLSDLEELAPYAFAESGTTFVSMQNAARLLHAFFSLTVDGPTTSKNTTKPPEAAYVTTLRGSRGMDHRRKSADMF